MSHVGTNIMVENLNSVCVIDPDCKDEMALIHRVIKNLFLKKLHLVKAEIFEAPPRAILTLAQKSQKMAVKPLPTHIVELWVTPHESRAASFKIAYQAAAINAPKLSLVHGVKHTIQSAVKYLPRRQSTS